MNLGEVDRVWDRIVMAHALNHITHNEWDQMLRNASWYQMYVKPWRKRR